DLPLVEDAVGGGHALTLLTAWLRDQNAAVRPPLRRSLITGRPDGRLQRPTAFHGGRSRKQAPSGRAGGRLRGLTWGVCSGSRRREAPCGKRLEPMSQESVSGVRPSTNSPDRPSI